jgi:hypothetical protein
MSSPNKIRYTPKHSFDWHVFYPGDIVKRISTGTTHTVTGRFRAVPPSTYPNYSIPFYKIEIDGDGKARSMRDFVPENANDHELALADSGIMLKRTRKNNKPAKCCTIMGGRKRRRTKSKRV